MKFFDYDEHDMTPPVELIILDFTNNAYKTYNVKFNSIENAKLFYRDSYAPSIKLDRKWETVTVDCNDEDLKILENDKEYYNIKHIVDVTIK